MATRKNPKISLPKQWTNAQVRVNPQGKVQVKIAKNKVLTSEQREAERQYKKAKTGSEYSRAYDKLMRADYHAAEDRKWRRRTKGR